MLHKTRLSFFCMNFCMLIACTSAFAADEVTTTTTTSDPLTGSTTTVVEKKVITTSAPAPKVVVVEPSNYVNCFNVSAGWYNNVWADAHKVCQYTNSPEGLAWVQGYWQCTDYVAESGACKNWDWKDAHWVKAFEVY